MRVRDAIGTLGMRSGSAQLRERVRQEKPTIRELYLRTGVTGSARIGTPSDIADAMQEWFENGACDGFNITPAHLPGGCEKISGSNVRRAATLPRVWIGSWTAQYKPAGKRRPTR